eukprot:147329_1
MSYNVPTDYVVIIGDDFNERGFIYQSDVIYIQNISVVLDLQQHFGNNQQSVSEHELCLNQRSEFSLQTAARSFRAAYYDSLLYFFIYRKDIEVLDTTQIIITVKETRSPPETFGTFLATDYPFTQINDNVFWYTGIGSKLVKYNLITANYTVLNYFAEPHSAAATLCNNVTDILWSGSRSIYIYNINDNQWTHDNVSMIMIVDHSHTCSIYDEKMYIFGGFVSTVEGTIVNSLDTIYEYDLIQNTLQLLDCKLTVPFAGLTSIVYKNYIYLFTTTNSMTTTWDTMDKFPIQIFNVLDNTIWETPMKQKIGDFSELYLDTITNQMMVAKKDIIYSYNDEIILIDFSLLQNQAIIPG